MNGHQEGVIGIAVDQELTTEERAIVMVRIEWKV